MSKHARLSPSDWARWMTCAGAVPFTESISEMLEARPGGLDPTTSAAASGTQAHEYGEKMIVSQLHPVESARLQASEQALKIRRDMEQNFIENAEKYASWATEFVFSRPNIPWGVELSAPLWYEPESRGTADFWAVDGDTLVVVDYKSGRLKVDVENNLQIAIYLIAIYDAISAFNPQIRKFRAGVMQPFTAPRGKSEPSWWDFDMGELEHIRSVVSAGAREVWNPILGNHRLVVSDKGCRFCAAKPFCPAQNEAVDAFAGLVAEDPKAIDGDVLFGIFGKLRSYRSFLDSVEDFIRDQSDEDLRTQGYARKDGSKKRSWTGAEEAIVQSLKDIGVEPYEEVLKTPAKVEKELGSYDLLAPFMQLDFNRPTVYRAKAGEKTFKVSK